MSTLRLPTVVLFLLASLVPAACSHGKARDIAGALADRLTDALNVDGAQKKDGTAPPTDSSVPDRPAIAEVQLPEVLHADAPFTILLSSTATDTAGVAGVVLLVPKASHYLSVPATLSLEGERGVIRLTGRLSDTELKGDFSLMFALIGTDGKAGAYVTKPIRLSREAKVCSDEACCNGGAWQAQDEFCRKGDDYPCTIDRCQADHSCLSTLYSEACQIEGKCYASMERKPDNSCQKCYPGNVQNDWTTFEDGASCDAGSGADSGQCQSGVCLPLAADGDPESDSGEAESEAEADAVDEQEVADVEQDGDGERPEQDPDPAESETETDADEAMPLAWVTIPEGNYMMGCLSVDMGCYANESPHHPVTMKSFEMLKTEVTQAQFKELLGRNPSQFTACGVNCPVESVSWSDANQFCTTIGGRLPTEAEWEYAARAGGISIYPCGADPSCLPSIAWHAENSQQTPHPVGQLAPNAWNLYDMAGNVSEWVEDTISTDYTNAPTDGSAWVQLDITNRVVRGGSWDAPAGSSIHRSSYRGSSDPTPSPAANTFGFRCARDLPADGDADNDADSEPVVASVAEIQDATTTGHPTPGSVIALNHVVVTSPLLHISIKWPGFFVSDVGGGPYSGIFVLWDSFIYTNPPTLAVGDQISLVGKYVEYSSPSTATHLLTEIMIAGGTSNGIGSISMDNTTAAVPNPVTAPPAAIATGGVDSEKYQGSRVLIENVTVASSDSKGFTVDGGLLVGNLFYPFVTPAIGTRYASISGFLYTDNDTYILMPLAAEDLVTSTAYAANFCDYNSCFVPPPTDQTECFGDTISMTCPAEGQDYYGQDAQYSAKHRTRSFTCHDSSGSTIPCSMVALPGETVEDSLTGLVWQREIPSSYSGCAAGTLCTLPEAKTYCENLVLGPFSDYRLPTLHELIGLASYAKNAPTYDSVSILTRESDATYWSSSANVGEPSVGLAFSSKDGTTVTQGSPEASPQTLRCVRSATSFLPPSYPRFEPATVNSESYYTDRITGLIWKDGTTVVSSWMGAFALCENASFAGRTDWRVPNLHELMSLVDFSQAAAPYCEIPSAPKSAVWTSTTPANTTSEAYIVDFNYASLSRLMKSDSTQTAWCVTGPDQSVSGR